MSFAKQLFKRNGNAEFLAHRCNLFFDMHRAEAVGRRFAAHRADEHVLGRVFKIHKLCHIHGIAAFFQKLGAERICRKCRKTLLDQTVIGKDREVFRVDPAVCFLLAARHGKMYFAPLFTANDSA